MVSRSEFKSAIEYSVLGPAQKRTIQDYADECEQFIVKLKDALHYLLEQTVDQDLKHGIDLTEGEADARQHALAVLAQLEEALDAT